MFKKIAKEFIKFGLNPVPVGLDKIPKRRDHSSVPMTEDEVDRYNFEGIGISCGYISNGVEVLDIDLKHSDDPKRLMRDLKANISDKLLLKLVVQSTISGGYHFIYKSEDVQSSKKLAMNDKGEVLIETRGIGSYIKVEPSKGYKIIQGNLSDIPVITPEERLSILIAAKMLNQQLEKESRKRNTNEESKYLNKFPEYNSDINIGRSLLEEHGWQVHSEREDWVNYTRPNKNISDGLSGGYNKVGKYFISFSTSQANFDTEKCYNNHAILAELEFNGRYDMAYAHLYKEGMGVEDDKKDDDDSEAEGDLDFLVDLEEENTNLSKVMHGELEIGKPTGWNNVDEYYRHKSNHVTIFLGSDNIGKSLFIIHLSAAANLLHGFKYGIIAPENDTYITRKRVIESMAGKTLEELEREPLVYDKLLKRSRRDFHIIKNGKHYTLDDALNMGAKLHKTFGIDYFLIDPYSFFSIGGSSNNFAHDNEMMSKMLVFAEKYCSIIIMAHPNSTAVRENRDEHGFITSPNKYQISGGNLYANRTHDFVSLHRVINHTDRDIRKTMQFTVEKIKTVETGGKPHIKGEWCELVYERRDNFLGYWNGDQNPIYNIIKSKESIKNNN